MRGGTKGGKSSFGVFMSCLALAATAAQSFVMPCFTNVSNVCPECEVNVFTEREFSAPCFSTDDSSVVVSKSFRQMFCESSDSSASCFSTDVSSNVKNPKRIPLHGKCCARKPPKFRQMFCELSDSSAPCSSTDDSSNVFSTLRNMFCETSNSSAMHPESCEVLWGLPAMENGTFGEKPGKSQNETFGEKPEKSRYQLCAGSSLAVPESTENADCSSTDGAFQQWKTGLLVKSLKSPKTGLLAKSLKSPKTGLW